MTYGDIMSDRKDSRWDKGEFQKKKPVNIEDRKNITAYYLHGIQIGKPSDELLEELEQRYDRSSRQIQRYIANVKANDYEAIVQLAKKSEQSVQPEYSQSVIAHDRRIFEETNKTLSEQALYEFLNYVDQQREYRSSGINPLRDFVDYCNYETNQYLNSSLKSETSSLNRALSELIEYLCLNSSQGINEGEDTVYPLFPRANPIFSLYLDQTCNNSDVTTEELSIKFEEFREYVSNEDNKRQLTFLMEKQLPRLYAITDSVHPFTRWDYKKEYYRGIKELTKLLNQAETKYRAYRAIARDTLLV